MFASATSGDKPNNSKFSTCSVNNITEVLYEVLQQNPKIKSHGKKRNCFTDRKNLLQKEFKFLCFVIERKSFCGNQIREPGEECDCGFTKQDCENMGDKCCIPRDEAPSDRDNCKRKPGKMCSPSEGLCCKPDTCSFYTIRERRLCREDSECQFEQHCSGAGPECPESVPKHDGLPCQNTTKVCHQGACNGSICAQAGLKDCFLTEGKPEQLCFLACEKNGLCLSSSDLPELKDFTQYGRKPGQGLLLHPGSPCNNYKGYCDIFRKCRSVDANGPLARLKSLVFNPETINTMSQWVKEHWWACVLIGLAILMLMALFVKCCAVHTPSTNPNKLPPAHFTETLRHPGTLLVRSIFFSLIHLFHIH
jgi:disintegrin and metalloproteinase domain-containing protein 10